MIRLLRLATEAAALTEPSLSSGRHAQNGVAARADNDGLGVREDGCDGEASLAFDVHEVAVRALYQPLQLVRALLKLRSRVKQINITRENLRIRYVETAVSTQSVRGRAIGRESWEGIAERPSERGKFPNRSTNSTKGISTSSCHGYTPGRAAGTVNADFFIDEAVRR